jgi:pimeloyl-ACP methyl ester carboxylesterase
VAEDRLTGQGRQIEIKFVVFPASGHHRAPDPVVYFAGGPDVSAIGDIPDKLTRLAGLSQDRDLVFIDQQGTGGSNRLNCPLTTRHARRPVPLSAAASSSAWPACVAAPTCGSRLPSGTTRRAT